MSQPSGELREPITDAADNGPADCGYFPADGWPHRFAKRYHKDACSACDDIEQTRYEAAERSEVERYRTALQKIADKWDASKVSGGFGVSAGDLALIAREALGREE